MRTPLPAQHNHSHNLLLVRLICALSGIFPLLILGVRVIGHSQPPPTALAVLHLTECTLPCWLNIVPGDTPFAVAVDNVREATPSGIFTSGYATAVTAAYLLGSPMGQVGIYADERGTVLQLTLLTHTIQGVMFGDVVSFLGTPACTLRNPEAVIYTSPSTFAVLIPSRSNRGWHAPLDHIEIRPIEGDQSPCVSLTN
jgi:hypothetical protein